MSEVEFDFFRDFEKIQGRARCCDKDFGGSHYHCGNCGEVSSMLGHFVSVSSPKMAEMIGRPVGFRGFTCEAGDDEGDTT